MAKKSDVSPTTFYKMVANLRVRILNMDIETLPDELKSVLNNQKLTDDLIRTQLSPAQIRQLLELLYQN
ncbi:MAG: hypothetical protein LBF37_02030 [Rickettsiales bacterium]|nr:hypothetical protein [Rickettsiales bacterium]